MNHVTLLLVQDHAEKKPFVSSHDAQVIFTSGQIWGNGNFEPMEGFNYHKQRYWALRTK